MLYPEVSRCKEAYPIARYLCWAYCADGHKTYPQCDKAPLIGGGDIDIEANHLKAWLRYGIKIGGAKSLADLMCPKRTSDGHGVYRTWYESLKCQCEASTQMFDKVFEAWVCPPSISRVPSTHIERKRKLSALCGQVCPKYGDTMGTLFHLFAWHGMNPRGFKATIMKHCTEERVGAYFKRHPALQGHSGCGKSALTRPIVGCDEAMYDGLLCSAKLPSAHGLTRWRHFTPTMDTDILISPELEKAFNEKCVEETEMSNLCNNTATFDPQHCRWNIESNLPVLCLTHGHNYAKVSDKGSLFNRLDLIKMHGLELPNVTTEHSWMITRETMSTFLTQDDVMELAPAWFKEAYLRQR